MPGKLKRTLPTPVIAVSVAEAAKAINVSRGSVYNLIREGKLVTRKIGSRSVILMSDLQHLLESL